MRPETTPTPARRELRARRILPLAVPLLLFAAALSMACTNSSSPANNANKAGGGAVPKPSTEPEPRSTDDRPIIVTGGSVDLFFDQNDYLPFAGPTPTPAWPLPTPTPTPETGIQTFSSEGTKITSFRVYDDRENEPDGTLICGGDHPDFGNGELRLTYKVGSIFRYVVIRSVTDADHTKNRVYITFNPESGLPPRRPNKPGKYFNRRASLERVEWGPDATTQQCEIPANIRKDVKVEIDAATGP